MPKKPPRIANAILRWVLPPKDRDYLLGDYEESFQRKLEEKSAISASLWYWEQSTRTAPAYFFESFYWRMVMLKNYLIIAFRNIRRHKGYSFISIASLALGLACCFLISGLIIYELSYDNFHENSANIYRVNRDVFERGRQYYVSMTPYQLMQGLLDEYQEITHATREKTIGDSLVGNKKTSFYVKRIKTGVIQNIPPNSIFQFDMAVSFNPPFDYPRPDNWASVSLTTYVQLNPEASVDVFTRKIRDFIQIRMDKNIEKQVRLFLEPFEDIRLSKYADSPRQTLYLYSLCAFVILLIACINFINLSTARSSGRAKEIGIRKKEIGIRKVLGASASRIVLMLSREFIKWVIIANAIAWPLAYFVMSQWLQNFAYRTSIGLWIFILSALLAVALAVLTISFQAFKAGTANPVDSLRYE
jgi:uncharacterized membrane protein